ncbi:MAG: hypothetical protein V3S21_05370 [Xanthomonadales bacterium]
MLRAFLPFIFVGVGSMAGGISRYGLSLVTLENIRVIHYLPVKVG